MHKQKIYLDTSVISHLKAEDTPEKMRDTLDFWEELKNGKYEVYVSNVTIEELTRCLEPKKTILFELLSQINYLEANENEESGELAEKYIKYGVLSQKSLNDCRHIAIATRLECKYIISWNFKHFVNVNTINKVHGVNIMLGYNQLQILPPSMMLEGDE